MSHRTLNCGYVPLVDSAPLIIAKDLGFAADEGLTLNLLKQPSWAALRDLLALGHLDAAHILSPTPAAMTLGLSGTAVKIDAPLVLSANGSVVGCSGQLASAMRANGWSGTADNLRATADHMLNSLDRPLNVGVPFLFSMHRLLFAYLVAAETAQSDRIKFVVTPPPLMAKAVAEGEIDVFCVGEPWGTVATSLSQAEILFPGAAIWAHSPEKVIGFRRDWIAANDEACGALVRSLYRATQWLDHPGNRPLASAILSRSEHLDLPEQQIDPAINRRMRFKSGEAPRAIPNFLKFHDAGTNFPWRSQGAWIGAQIARLHGLDPEKTASIAASCFRPDLYRKYLAERGADMPGASSKIEGSLAHETAVASTRGEMILGPDAFFDGKTFDFGPL